MTFRLPAARVGLLLVLPIFASTLGACASSRAARHQTAQEAYDKGMRAFERRRWDEAVDLFTGVLDYGRTPANEWADDAQLMLARTYVRQGEHILAASEFSRFSEQYRTDPRAPDAEYERALAYASLSPTFELDQTNTERAVTYLQLFLERYPESSRRAEAEAKILELRDKMAHKAFATGRLYERRDLYEAAALSYEQAFAKYPDSQWADDALVGMARSYNAFAARSVRERQPERFQKAVDAARRFAELFSQSPMRAEMERLDAEARAGLAAAATASR